MLLNIPEEQKRKKEGFFFFIDGLKDKKEKE